jgi:multiple sugar transport system substrate-binding protein
MSNLNLRGLAWGHRRATGPLEPLGNAFRRAHPNVVIEWTVRPLSDFEQQPIAAIAGQFDLLIVDHPFCGDIAAARAFVPLEEAMPDLVGPGADRLYVGQSLASYRYAGHVWAAPIDAATPHAAFRADLLGRVDCEVPKSWEETIALGQRLRRSGLWLATPVASPHAFATVASLMANLGRPIATNPEDQFAFDPQAMAIALDALDAILALSPPETLSWNAISIEEAMVARDDLVFTPSVYGYATYAEADMRAPLRFADFCGLAPPFAAGSMLGGTGLGISAAADCREAAVEFVRFCLSREAQDRIIPENHGQPALASAWEEPANDARFGGFYSAVRHSLDTAWIRPRRPSYIRFQAEAGRLIEAYCRRELGKRATLEAVNAAGHKIFDRASHLERSHASGRSQP